MPTANYAWPYPAGSSAPNVPVDIKALADAADATVDAIDDRLDIVETRPRGLVGRGRRTTVSTATTGIVGVIRLASISVIAGRAYRIVATIHPRSSSSGDRILTEIRHTTNGTTPGTGSAVLPGGQHYTTAAPGGVSDSAQFEFVYEPAVSVGLQVILTVTREAGGAGNVTLYADSSAVTEVAVYDDGLATGNSGTNI